MLYITFVCINTKQNYLKITSRLKSSANILYIPSDFKKIIMEGGKSSSTS